MKSTCKFIILTLFACLSVAAQSQERTITGVVNDNSGVGLPAVNVTVKGTTAGVVTDMDGKYSIKVSGNESTLVISYVGYKSVEIPVGNQSSVNVSLSENVQQLNEVVVIGYGVQKRSDLTGAVASVKAEDMAKMATTSIATALQGKAAGIQIAQNTGAPGSAITVRIRGISSVTEGSTPLWIIDGVQGDPNSVNPNDIQSVEILKDASSSAIYGAAGANGVVLVTTKSGNINNKAEVNVDYFHGIQEVPNRIDAANSKEFGSMYLEYQAISSKGKNITKVQFPNYKTEPTYDYQDMVFRLAKMDNVSVGASGGTDKFSGYMGLGYINQEGILKSSEYQKFNFRLKSNYTPNKWLKLGENASFTYDKNFGWDEWQYSNEYTSPIVSAILVLPNHAPYNSDGNWKAREFGNSDGPMPSIDMMNNTRRNYSGNITFNVVIEPLKGLTYETKVNLGTWIGANNQNFSPTFDYGSSPGQFNRTSSISRYFEQGHSYQVQNILSYNTSILNDFNLGLLAAHEVGTSEALNMGASRLDLYTEAPEMWYFNSSRNDTSLSQLPTGSGYKSAGYSYIGRVNFDYKGKYLLQGNFRQDWSSKFGPNKRKGNFPGFSVGWKFSEEGFVKNNLKFLSFGKLRYGLGHAGNNAIRDYAYYGTVSSVNGFKYALNNTASSSAGYAPDVLPNRSIHWEDVETQNYGVDLGFFENKLNITVDKFERHNNGMLVKNSIPYYAGWIVRDVFQESGGVDPQPIENIGKITNKGWEVTLGWKDNIGKLSYSIDANYTYITNEATKLGIDSIKYGGYFMSLSKFCRTVEGGPIGDFYGFKVEKIFQLSDTGILANGKRGITNQPYILNSKGEKVFAQSSAQPGDFKYADINGDGKITDKDISVIGNPNPKHLLGLNINLEYGLFDLSMFWQGTFGNDIMNLAKYYGYNQSGLYNWNADYVNNHYRESEIVAKDVNGNIIETFPANTSSKYPRLDPLNKNGNFDKISDFYVEDGSYVRLKNIQIGLRLPTSLLNKLTIKEFRVYVGAKNLLTFTKYSGMDPEVPQNDVLASGIDRASYPQARLYIIGASIKF